MSTYTASTSVYQGNLVAVRAMVPELDAQARALSEGLCSARLGDLARSVQQAERIGTADALSSVWRQLEQALPAWDATFSSGTTSALTQAWREVEHLTQAPDSTPAALPQAFGSLTRALAVATTELATTERQLTAAAAGLALGDLGYVVHRADGDHVTGFEASRGHEKLLVQVGDGGEVVTDHLGLSEAVSCGTTQQAFVDQLATYGVAIAEQDRQDHRDPRGGGLALRSARAAGRTAAERIVSSFGHGAGRKQAARRMTREERA